jgi:GT2 family glycosyltransferase
MSLSIVIPTYGRDEVLTDTIAQLLAQASPADEILVVDQTTDHGLRTQDFLTRHHAAGAIRWILQQPAGTVGAMNRGLLDARGELVLFLDDDIIPGAELVAAHRRAYAEAPEAWAVVGQVLQPEDWGTLDSASVGSASVDRASVAGQATDHGPPTTDHGHIDRPDACGSRLRSPGSDPTDVPAYQRTDARTRAATGLTQDLHFRFSGGNADWVTNVMACNLSVKRERALAMGGFDGNFTPPVAYRFETEFAKRLLAAGGRIRFAPRASIRHLRAARGGTRSQGSHLTSASPVHGVGDYYYALRCGRGWERVWYILRRPMREVRTRFHLRHPWYIPVKLIGELGALALALRLWRNGPRLLPAKQEMGTGHEDAQEAHRESV